MRRSVSVIIPARNCALTISAAIQSALSQTYIPDEVIVIDDGSTDETRSIAKSFGDKVRVLPGPCQGAGPARNLGIENATGQYIAFLDADDVWYSTKLERQIPFVAPGVLVGSYANYVVGPKKFRVGTSIRTSSDAEAAFYISSGKGLPALLSSWVLLREDLLNGGLFDPLYVYSQDYELLMRLVDRNMQVKIIRTPLLDYLIHEASESATEYIEQWLTAEYVRATRNANFKMSLEDWLLTGFTNKRIMRVARAGQLFRNALVALSDIKTLPRAALLLARSFVLNPKRFVHKALTQGRRTKKWAGKH